MKVRTNKLSLRNGTLCSARLTQDGDVVVVRTVVKTATPTNIGTSIVRKPFELHASCAEGKLLCAPAPSGGVELFSLHLYRCTPV